MVISLLELEISVEVDDGVCKKLRQSEWIRSEAVGFNGGIWLLWNQTEINLKVTVCSQVLAVVSSREEDGN